MRRHRILIAPLLVAVLAFAACGDDSSSTDETAAAPTEVATEAPTVAATEAPSAEAPVSEGLSEGDGDVKVTGKLGAAPKIEVPKGGKAPTGLLYKDIKVGTGPAAAAGQTVSVQYYGALYADGTKFDASWDRGGEPFEFSLGAGMVIPGWDQGVAGMKKGGRRLLVIPPDLGYGPQGSGPIPPNATLVFVVDMENITSP